MLNDSLHLFFALDELIVMESKKNPISISSAFTKESFNKD